MKFVIISWRNFETFESKNHWKFKNVLAKKVRNEQKQAIFKFICGIFETFVLQDYGKFLEKIKCLLKSMCI